MQDIYNIPLRLGLFFRRVDKSVPCPPPISITVLNCEKSYMEEIDETCDEGALPLHY